MVRTKNRIRLCAVLIIVNVAFIWGNSLMPAATSSAISNFVYGILRQFVSGQDTAVMGGGTGLLRKLAHLTEFACLGLLWCWYLLMGKRKPVFALLPGLCTACVDETIQCFVPGRGPRVTDVAIDLFGVCLGIGVMLLISYLKSRPWRKKT